jgi:hypothetical protein
MPLQVMKFHSAICNALNCLVCAIALSSCSTRDDQPRLGERPSKMERLGASFEVRKDAQDKKYDELWNRFMH